MKMYCVVRINKLSGEIEHCALSDAPVKLNMVASINPGPPVKTIPAVPTEVHRLEFFEFNSSTGFVSASYFLSKCIVEGFTVEDKLKTGAKVIVREVTDSIQNLILTTESDMRQNFEKSKQLAKEQALMKLKEQERQFREGIIDDIVQRLKQC